ncbi:MAG TPA: c-type cytochrome biogenesis protein CcmI [Gammaproteobacteria bacterium]|nr:c-type cytochrome biogenesis protein CcmI [Gammaproteobacteria bacterium]|tara:strand:- start:2705 stop:3967 length:1263 start_codon:yes stop_codon:yes gene_type:complete
MFWLLTICLFIAAALFVVVPLWSANRGGAQESIQLRKAANIALFHERNDEFEAELAEGNLDQSQFDALILELQQGLLADVDSAAQAAAPEPAKTKPKQSQLRGSGIIRNVIPLALVLFMSVLAYSLYNQWGYIDDVELMDLFRRTVNNTADIEETRSLIVSLGEVVQADADKEWAWYFLAENFANLNMFSEAQIAYRQAANRIEEGPEKALILGRVALAMYITAGLEFTPGILEVVEEARALNPNEISILQLLAADADQRQDYKSAIAYWRLLIQASPSSEQARLLRESIAAAQILMADSGQDVDAGPVVEVTLTLFEGIELDPNLRVFIAVRNAQREGLPPLAATQLRVADLPATIRLDNASAVGPFNLSSADTVFVSALVSFAGTANPSTGDYRVVSENFVHNGQHAVIDLVLSERVL